MLKIKGKIMHVHGDSKISDQIRFIRDTTMLKEGIFTGSLEVK